MPNAATCDLFISYRRSDSAGHARALYRDLCRRFEKERIFFDRESIEAGTVFPERLRKGVEACHVLLALIAPGWLDATAPGGGRRLDSEEDFVRREIGTALDLGRRVIPVLFDDTPVPKAAQLPEPLRGLAALDALMLRGKNFEYDTQLEELVRLLAAVPGMPAPLPPSEGVIVESGLDFDVYRGTRYIPIRLRAPLRAAFAPIIEDRTKIFAGRHQVFERIMQFAAREEGGYLVITAPPGFGKTALIANLVSATPEAFAYHFFARLYGEETLDEKFFLQNVLQQMAAWHGHSAELPDAINELRALFHQFVSTPLEYSRVLVLDGLDEVTGWKLEPYLARQLPPRLHVVATLRDVGQEWRTEYGFPPDQLSALPLGGLEAGEIRELFAGLGAAGLRIANDDALVEHIVQRAAYEDDPRLGADPFYVRFLAEDVASADVAPEEIPAQPKGLASYLDRWWKQIVLLAGDAPVRDLFGTLAAAVGPLARADLEAMNASLRDDWAGDFFDQVLARVRRVVRQDRDGRYSLAHPRLRRYIADPGRIGKINDYRNRLLEYCSRWKEHRSPYALAFQATHLADAGRHDDLYRLFSGEWIAAHWQVLRTYGPLVADLDRTAKALLAAPAPDYTRALALVVARQTGRELMLGFPEELFVAWIEQGDVERTLACLAALGKTRGRAIDPLIAVAGKLLELHRNGVGDYANVAADLLMQAADQIALVRMTKNQFDALTALAELLAANKGLADTARHRLIRLALEFADKSADEVFRLAGAGAIASALCASEPDLDTARDLLVRTRDSLASIASAADQAFIVQCLLPAMEAMAPAEVLPEMNRLIEQGSPLLEHGSLVKNPCIRLLERWNPSAGEEPDEAASILVRFAELYLRDPASFYVGSALGAIVPHLCKLGQVSAALALIDRCGQASALDAARVVVNSIDILLEFAPESAPGWLQSALELTDPSFHDMPVNRDLFAASVTDALAASGDWDAAFRLAETLPPRERADTLVDLLRRAGSIFGPKGPAREQVIDRTMKLAAGLDDTDIDKRARIGTVAAQVLGFSAGGRAASELAQATALCLAHLPEGDSDNLRRLHAVALHEDGATGEALAAVRLMAWVPTVAATFASLLDSGIGEPVRRDTYARALMEELRQREQASLFGEALKKLTPVVVRLLKEDASLGAALGDYIIARGGLLRRDDAIPVYATITAGACHINVAYGAHQFNELLTWIETLQANNVEVSASTIADVIVQVASVAGLLGDQLPQLVNRMQSLADRFTEGNDAIVVRGALCLVDAQRDCQAVRNGMERILGEFEAMDAAPSAALYLTRMIADLVGRRVGENEAQARAADSLAEAVVRCADRCPEQAAEVLEQLISKVLGIRSGEDRAQALIDIFGKLKNGPPGWPPLPESLLSSALQRAQLNGDLESAVLKAAVATICDANNPDSAEHFARQSASPPLLEDLLVTVNNARERLALGELSPFEREFVEVGNRGLAQAVLHSVKVEADNMNVLQYLVKEMVSEQWGTERVRLLSDFLPSAAAPLRALHRTGEIGRLISEVESFDHAFLAAAHIIGQGS